MTRLCGQFLIATGIGHAAVGLLLFRQPIADILREGLINTVRGQFDREAAFWFLLFSPVCVALGQLVTRAVADGDASTLRSLGATLLAIGVVGIALMPVSGFWIVVAIAVLMLRAGRSTRVSGADQSGSQLASSRSE
jgi:hypothetical protein